MTDLGAEAALDAEHDDPHVEFLAWVAEIYRRQGLPPGVARFFNLGSLPEEKKVTKTPVKKREYKPIYCPKIEALRKKAKEQKSTYQESNKKLLTERAMERVTNILDRIEKDKHILENVLASMEKKNIQMDMNGNERIAVTTREIEKIKTNINLMNGDVKGCKNATDRETKIWKDKEEQAKTDWEKAIEEWDNTKEQIKEQKKERIKAMEHHAAEENDRIDREIQNIKDKQVKEENNINKNIEAKKITLSTLREQIGKNIQKKKEEEAEQIAIYDAEIKKLKDAELYEKEKADSNIAAKRTQRIEIKKQMEKNLKVMERTEHEKKLKYVEVAKKRKMEKDIEKRTKTLNMAKDESEKRIRHM